MHSVVRLNKSEIRLAGGRLDRAQSSVIMLASKFHSYALFNINTDKEVEKFNFLFFFKKLRKILLQAVHIIVPRKTKYLIWQVFFHSILTYFQFLHNLNTTRKNTRVPENTQINNHQHNAQKDKG